MKVRSLIDHSSGHRAAVAASLTLAIVGGMITPLAASAATAQAAQTARSAQAAPPLVTTSAPATVAAAPATTTLVAPSTVATPAPKAPAPKAAVPKKRSVRETIAYVGKQAGLSAAEVSALLWIAKRESNFHPTSKSRSGCYGLFQLSSKISAGHPWKDPAWNTSRAIKYMRGRYHGVLRAKAFWQAHHWY